MIEQKLNAYVVSLNFASGKNVVQTVFAPGPEGAAAIVTHDIMLKPEIRDETALTGCLVGAIAEEWLRTAHRVIVEGGKPEGEVVRLVSDNLRPVAPEGSQGQTLPSQMPDTAYNQPPKAIEKRIDPSHSWPTSLEKLSSDDFCNKCNVSAAHFYATTECTGTPMWPSGPSAA